MLRLAIFLAVVLVLFQAGARNVAPPALDPAPFDLSATTATDPRLLVARAADRPEADNVWHVAVSRLPLRSGPSPAYPELGALGEGQTVIGDGIGGGDWIWVRTEDSALAGYTPSDLLTR